MPKARPLTAKQQRFCEEYLVDLNATQAAIRAGYSERTARSVGCENLTKPDVAARIAEMKLARSTRTEITADAVLERFWNAATADAREIVEHRVGPCRYCYGVDHQYQRTPAERVEDYARWSKLSELGRVGHELSDVANGFDERGGVGYDRRKAPHADCPECFGSGIGYVIIADMRDLSVPAATLYAGIKQSKDGSLEVKLHDQPGTLRDVARHLGMFVEKHEHSGRNGEPLNLAPVILYMPANGRDNVA